MAGGQVERLMRGAVLVLAASIALSVLNATVLLRSTATAAPDKINFQGRITDANGSPIHSPVGVPMAFEIWKNGEPAARWAEVWAAVPVLNGIFTVRLGDNSAPGSLSAANVFNGDDLEVKVVVDGAPYATIPLSTAGYSIYAGFAATAGNAAQLGGVEADQHVLVDGSRAFTGDVAMGGHKITGLASGTDAGDAVTIGQVSATYLPLAGGTMTGDIELSEQHKVTGLAAATENDDAVRRDQVDGVYLPLVGGAMTGALSLSGTPTEDEHAATKEYVDQFAGYHVIPVFAARTIPPQPQNPPSGGDMKLFDRYLVLGESGDWVGHLGEIATWTGSGWAYEWPRIGAIIWSRSDKRFYIRDWLAANPDDYVSLDHNKLQGFDGGDATATPVEMYHLTAAQHTDLTDGQDSAGHYHATDRDLANATGSLPSDAAHGDLGGGTLHANAIPVGDPNTPAGADGFMSAADKTKIDGLYTADQAVKCFQSFVRVTYPGNQVGIYNPTLTHNLGLTNISLLNWHTMLAGQPRYLYEFDSDEYRIIVIMALAFHWRRDIQTNPEWVEFYGANDIWNETERTTDGFIRNGLTANGLTGTFAVYGDIDVGITMTMWAHKK